MLSASSGKDEATFLYGLGRIAAIGTDAKDTRYYAPDVRGSLRATTDARGKPRSTSSYDAWGVPQDESQDSSGLAGIFGFTGERQDAKAGLEYLRARWYSPALGVFLSPDPARGRLADPRTLAPYAYALDDPTSKVDRSGLSASSLLDGAQGYASAATAFYDDPRAQPTATAQPFGQSAAYAIAGTFRDLDSSDPATQAAAFLKLSAVGVGVAVPAALALPGETVAGAASSIVGAGSAVATGVAGLFQKARSWFSTASLVQPPNLRIYAAEGRVLAAERAGVLSPGASGNIFATDARYAFGNIAQSDLAVSAHGANVAGYWEIAPQYGQRFAYAGRVTATQLWEGGGREFTWAGSIPYEDLGAFQRIPWSAYPSP